MQILIVEDELLAAKKIQKTLGSVDSSAVVMAVTDSIETTVEWLRNNPAPDLILMDIELSDGQSFEIYNHVEIKSAVIFTTSYDEHALKAFKVNSIDYLLKPIQKDDLTSALDKYRQRKALYAEKPAPAQNLEALIKELRQKLQPKDFRRRFLVKQANKLVSIETEEIAYFFSDGRLNFFKTKENERFVVDYTLDELETVLNPADFFRISRGFFIGIGCIDQIHDYPGSRLLLYLKPAIDKDVIVSREKVTDFKNWLGK